MGTWAPDRPGLWAPTLVSIRDVAQNVLVYVAFGALGVLSMRDRDRRARRSSEGAKVGHWLRLVVRIMALAILFSTANEVLQLYTSDRVASLTDIVSAAVGAMAGGLAISLWRSPK